MGILTGVRGKTLQPMSVYVLAETSNSPRTRIVDYIRCQRFRSLKVIFPYPLYVHSCHFRRLHIILNRRRLLPFLPYLIEVFPVYVCTCLIFKWFSFVLSGLVWTVSLLAGRKSRHYFETL